MKKRCFLTTIILTLPLLSSCGDGYDINKFDVVFDGDYQLWDYFDSSKLSVTYDGVKLEENQFVLDLSNFTSNAIGTSSVTISLRKDIKIAKTINVEVKNRTSSNILAIGDSCIEDLINYSNELTSESDANLSFNVYGLTCKDLSLNALYSSFVFDKTIFTFYRFDYENKKWETSNDLTIKGILSLGDIVWDVITLQQKSILAGSNDGYFILSNLINTMKSYISSLGRKVPVFSYSMPWAYKDGASIDNLYYELFNNSQNEMYKAIIDESENVVEASNLFDCIIPTSTSIQNARQSSFNNEDDLSSDGVDLDERYGRFIASLTLASKLSGYEAKHFAYSGRDGYKLSDSELDEIYTIVDNSIKNPYQLAIN